MISSRDTMGAPVLVVDIGGTKVLVAAAQARTILGVERFSTLPARGPDDLVERIGLAAEMAIRVAGIPWPERILVGLPGSIDRERGVLASAANIPVDEYPLATVLSSRLRDVAVSLEADVNCAVVGEHECGALRGTISGAYLTISTGIGMGLIINGRLHRGAANIAGQIGHIPVVTEAGLPCPCGASGCLERYSSGRAIVERAAMQRSASARHSATPGDIELSTEEIFRAVAEGNDEFRSIIDEAVEYLGQALVTVMRTVDPERLVIGGGVSHADGLIGRVADAAAQRCPPLRNAFMNRVAPAQLGDRSVLIGALAILANTDDSDHDGASQMVAAVRDVVRYR